MNTHSAPELPEHWQKRLQELAYQLWEAEGHPEGQAERHWFLAIEMLETDVVGKLPGVPVDDPHWLKRREQEHAAEAALPQPAPPLSGGPAEEPPKRPTEREIERRLKKIGARAI